MQDIPISVTAIGGDQLQAGSINSTVDLGTVTPGLIMGNTSGFVRPHIRGVGTTSVGPGLENSIASYIDGVYIASQPGALMSLSDVERVEVLKGPQGTLFGRNATGGVVQVITRQPGLVPTATVSVGYANYNTVRGDAYIAGPIADQLSASITAGATHQGDGWGRNLLSGRETHRTDLDLALRGKLRWDGTTTRATFSADYSYLDSTQVLANAPRGRPRALAPAFDGGRFDIEANFEPYRRIKAGGTALTIEQDIGSLVLTSISGFRALNFDQRLDGDFSPVAQLDFDYVQKDKQYSQELQLASTGDRALSWMIGGFFLHHKARYDPYQLKFAASTREVRSFQSTHSVSAFAQATYRLAERTNLTAGFRITAETRKVGGSGVLLSPAGATLGALFPSPVEQELKFYPATWRLALDHRLSDQLLVFGSSSRGFKSGGFNAQTPNVIGYEPERLDAYELGAKSDLLDGRMRWNASAFYYDYSNMQVSTYVGVVSQIYNGAKSRIYGLDVDAQYRIMRNLTLSAGLELLHNRFTDFPLAVVSTPLPTGAYLLAPGSATGNRLPFAADATINLGADYKIPVASGEVAANVTYLHNTGYCTEPDNRIRQGTYDILNASLRYAPKVEGWSANVWIKNLTDAAYALQFATNATTEFVAYSPPRTYGLTVGLNF